MLDALVLLDKAKRAQDACISAVAQLARHYRCSPDTLSGVVAAGRIRSTADRGAAAGAVS
jgi:hypothetical protein